MCFSLVVHVLKKFEDTWPFSAFRSRCVYCASRAIRVFRSLCYFLPKLGTTRSLELNWPLLNRVGPETECGGRLANPTMVLVVLEQIQTGTGVTNGVVSVIGLDLFNFSTAAPRFVNTHTECLLNLNMSRNARGSETIAQGWERVNRNPTPSFGILGPVTRESTFVIGIHFSRSGILSLGNRILSSRSGIYQSGSAIHRSESGISPSWSGVHHAESRTHGRDPGFNTRPYFYLFPLTLREQSMKQLFCHTFSSRCQQKSLSRWLSRLTSIFRGRSAQRRQFLELAEPTAQNCRLHGYSCLQPTLDDPLGIHKISNTWP